MHCGHNQEECGMVMGSFLLLRASRGELVPGHQSQQKRPHAAPDIINYCMLSVMTRYWVNQCGIRLQSYCEMPMVERVFYDQEGG